MDDKKSSAVVVEMMADIEEIIGQHYQAYAQKFPEQKDFWTTLVSEENHHAQWIRAMYSKVGDGLVSLNEKRFNAESIREFQARLAEMLKNLRGKEMSIKDALEESLSIEKMLLEKNFFEVFQTKSPEILEIVTRIVEETRSHRGRIEQMLEKY
ncbi:MAG TPA: hypothetical protein PL155_09080 [Candidatus Omnitrophota bacterium]|nr:hypothetical protein [Candidatus Omnitrophota bacterium]HPD85391.1 hypothetical protein [Candidatus Omnitrophota bacterium]HRZ04108.1 hypothetical protein [Candidatus Omnitrophota bacterium]